MESLNTKIIFTGDIAFSKHFHNGWSYESCCDDEIINYLKDSDYVVGKIESPVTDHPIERNDPLFTISTPPAAADYIRKLNISVWNLSNNHIMDCGVQGLRDTIICAEDHGAVVLGAGKTIKNAEQPIILGNSVKVGLLSVSRPWKHIMADEHTPGVLTWDKMNRIQAAIQKLRSSVDWVLIVAHGGEEFSLMQPPSIRKIYRKFLKYGADIVVAHHPHVIGNYEQFKKKAIFYSLGNFIFDTDFQRTFPATDTGILLRICFSHTSFYFDHLPIYICRDAHKIQKAVETPAIFQNIDEKNYHLLWPLAAKYFYQLSMKRQKITNIRLAYMPYWKFLLRQYYHGIRFNRERTVFLGRLLSECGIWKASSLKDISNYIIQKERF